MDTLTKTVSSPKEKKVPLWKKAVEQFGRTGYSYGDIVPHSWFHEHFGLGPKPSATKEFERWTQEYATVFSQFRAKMLADFTMDFQSVKGKGYLIIRPEHQVETAMKDTRKDVRKSLKQGVQRVTCLDTTGLSSQKRKEQTDALGFLGQLQSLTSPKKWK